MDSLLYLVYGFTISFCLQKNSGNDNVEKTVPK